MFKKLITIFLSTNLLIACASSRQPVPVGVVPKAKNASFSEEEYGHKILTELTQKWQIDYNNPKNTTVSEIVQRLTKVAGGEQDTWHVYILKDDNLKNAAATRGNHIFIWSGILKVTENDSQLATVLSHEIAHVIAGHTEPDPNEELKKLLINIGGMAANIAVSAASGGASWSGTVGNIASSATQEVGNGILVYPYTKEMEMEADQIGLFMMADAKYNPEAAVEFWTKAEKDADFSSSIPFFSSHPDAGDRLAHLKELLPQAIARYDVRKVETANTTPKKAARKTKTELAQAIQNQDPRAAEWIASSSSSANKIEEKQKPTQRTLEQQTFSEPVPSYAKEVPLPVSSWEVISDYAELYSEPNDNSKTIGEFKRGYMLEAIRELPEWIEISQPDTGFLKKSDLDSVSSLDSLD